MSFQLRRIVSAEGELGNTPLIFSAASLRDIFLPASSYEYQRAPYGHLKYFHFEDEKIIRRGKDYDAFAHLCPFPNLEGSYRHGNIEVSVGITLKK
jgi:hypothetical protein